MIALSRRTLTQDRLSPSPALCVGPKLGANTPCSRRASSGTCWRERAAREQQRQPIPYRRAQLSQRIFRLL